MSSTTFTNSKGTIDFSNTSGYHVVIQKSDGKDLPLARVSEFANPLEHGSDVFSEYLSSRVISYEGLIYIASGDTYTLQAALDDMKKVLSPVGGIGKLTKDGRYLNCYCRQFRYSHTTEIVDGVRFRVDFIAGDPRFYSSTNYSGNVAFGANYSGFIFPLSFPLAFGNAFINDINLATEYAYFASRLPTDSTPAWTKTITGAGTEVINSTVLITDGDNGAAETLYFSKTDTQITTTGITFETRFKCGAQNVPKENREIVIQNGTYEYRLSFETTKVYVNETSGYSLDTTDDFHVYRLTIDVSENWILYVDGVQRLSGSGHISTSGSRQIVYGDISAVSTVYHSEEWDYLRYWKDAVYTPGAEPADPDNTVTNAGNFDTYPVITIWGACVQPVIQNVTNNKKISLNLTLTSSEYLEIDMKNKTVKLNGTASRFSSLVDREFFAIEPGINELRYTAQTMQQESYASITFRDANI